VTPRALLIPLCVCLTIVRFADAAPIPPVVDEAHQALERYLTPTGVERVKQARAENEMIRIIDLPGFVALTNEWQLHGDSSLARYFRRRGVDEPHEMVYIISRTYWCRVHGKPLRLQEKIAQVKAAYAGRRRK
jgi:hypothetical protein